MTQYLAAAFCPEPHRWYRRQVLTLDTAGRLSACVPFTAETAHTKACTGLVFLYPLTDTEVLTPTRAFHWLTRTACWQPGQKAEETAPATWPATGTLWCLEGVDTTTGQLAPNAELHRLRP